MLDVGGEGGIQREYKYTYGDLCLDSHGRHVAWSDAGQMGRRGCRSQTLVHPRGRSCECNGLQRCHDVML